MPKINIDYWRRVSIYNTLSHPHPDIVKTELFKHRAVVDVAQIEEVGLPQQLFYALQIEVAELVPLGQDQHRIGPVHGLVFVGGKGNVVFDVLQPPGSFFHGLRVVGAKMSARGGQVADDGDGRALAHVVGVGFEGQAEHGQGHAAQVGVGRGGGSGKGVADFFGHDVLLAFIAVNGLLYQVHAGPGGFTDLGQGFGVLWKAGAAVSGAGVQELGADTPVPAHSPGYVLYVGTDLFAEVGYLVDKGDFHGQKGVGRVFDHFGGFDVGFDKGGFVQVQHAVDLPHNIAGLFAFGPDHDAVRMGKIPNSAAFTQKLGVADHVELVICAALVQLFLDPGTDAGAGADGHGAFVHYDAIPVHRAGDFPGNCFHVLQVGAAVVRRRRSYGDKNHFAIAHGLRGVGGKAQAAVIGIALYNRLKPRFIYRYFAL